MKDTLLFFLLFTLFGCNFSGSKETNNNSSKILSSPNITAIPVKKLISEVRDEALLIEENQKKQPKKIKAKKKSAKKKVLQSEYSKDNTFQNVPQENLASRNYKVNKNKTAHPQESMKMPSPKYDPIFASNPYYIAEGFDFPVGKPDADGYFLALRFGQKLHLGEDWNGVGGGNTDLGDPVYATGDGYVTFAEHLCCGWGNTVRIVHKLDNHPYYNYVESVSSHLNDIVVSSESFVRRGDLIGHIGTADGKYSAHLHLEFRTFLDMNIGPGYSADQFGYISPTPFIRQNR